MASPATSEHKRPGFDVTCIVGHVYFDSIEGYETPEESAFSLIGRHNAPGEYEFPGENAVIRVRVEHIT